jgi:hypothetical protein
MVRYHGKESFDFQILEHFDSPKEALAREAEVVNEDLLQDPLCLNIRLGGKGGWDYVNSLPHIHSSKAQKDRSPFNDDEWRKKNEDEIKTWTSEGGRAGALVRNEIYGNPNQDGSSFRGKSHFEETKQRMSESSKGQGLGKKNSQFGTMWITNGSENRKIKKDESIPKAWYKGRISCFSSVLEK